MTVTDVLTTGVEVIISKRSGELLSVECYRSSLCKLVGQCFCDVICCKTQLAFVSCDWSVPIRW